MRFCITMVRSSMVGRAPMASDMPQSNLLMEKPVLPTMNSSPIVRAPTPLCEYGPVSLM